MGTRYVSRLKGNTPRRRIGKKAESLRFLMRKGYRTPVTFVCRWNAFSNYVDGCPNVLLGLKSELAKRLDTQSAYAVRSSANVEDDLLHSFAGQFKSVLDVRGLDNVVASVQAIWDSARSRDVRAYLERNDIDPAGLKMAVLIQEMVDPVLSGVSFSKNPVTGRDDVVIEAVKGSGEALLQKGVTPQRWVDRSGRWLESPDGGEPQRDLIDTIVDETRAMAKAYGRPVDAEWVYDGQHVYWVQLRPVTAPDVDVYSDRISREFFPGMIKPLIWSINVPLVNGAWIELFTKLIGPNNIDPKRLAKSFCYRAYFNMGTLGEMFDTLGIPREGIQMLTGFDLEGADRSIIRPTARTYALLPRLLGFAAAMLAFGRRVDVFLPTMRSRYKGLPIDQVDRLRDGQLMDEIERLYSLTQQTAYFNIVTPLLAQVYAHLLKRWLNRHNVALESLDLTEDKELERYSPNAHLAVLSERYRELDQETRERIHTGGYDACLRLPSTDPLRQGLEQFIERFGHLSDSGNDFSSTPWREDPDLVIQMIANYVPPAGMPEAKMRLKDVDVPLLERPLIHWVYRRARRFMVYREAVSSLYVFGYGLFRVYFLALADRFVQRGILSSREDIFYLTLDEVRSVVVSGHQAGYEARIAERQREMESCQDVRLPSIIYGDDSPPLEAQTSDSLSGTPTARGRYTGPIRVVQGIRDFQSLNQGDILVIPYSDVGWTPLFAKAGAVIAESGGLLSHSSIVAREYGIPAVVSVPGACQLPDGIMATVDGARGDITLHTPDARGAKREGPQREVEDIP